MGITKSTTDEVGWWERCGLPLFALKRDVTVVRIVRTLRGEELVPKMNVCV